MSITFSEQLNIPKIYTPSDIDLYQKDKTRKMGDVVRYTHRCAVARYIGESGRQKHWFLTEGIERGGYRDRFYDTPKADVNKDVFEWEESGEGIILAQIKRGVGRSTPSYMSEAYWGGESEFEFEPGDFSPTGWKYLFVIKRFTDFNNINTIYVPTGSISD